MNNLEKIQNLPETKRKIIFWFSIIIIAIFLLFFVFNNLQKRLAELETENLKEELQIPALEEELQNLPQLNY